MIIYILTAIFIVSCLTLIFSVLLQPGKTDAGALFTSSISSTAFGARGTQTILSKITIGASIGFLVSALLLAMPALRGNVSVLNSATATETTATPTPEANTNTNANVATNAEVNANSAVTTNANVTTNK